MGKMDWCNGKVFTLYPRGPNSVLVTALRALLNLSGVYIACSAELGAMNAYYCHQIRGVQNISGKMNIV